MSENKSSIAREFLKVGDPMEDGTVVLSVNPENNKALFVPAGIFGGKATFGNQDDVVKAANRNVTHGHKDWRRITDAEGETLSNVWNKVAPLELRGRDAPWFWLASSNFYNYGSVRRGGEAFRGLDGWVGSLPVPVVRSGPARILDI